MPFSLKRLSRKFETKPEDTAHQQYGRQPVISNPVPPTGYVQPAPYQPTYPPNLMPKGCDGSSSMSSGRTGSTTKDLQYQQIPIRPAPPQQLPVHQIPEGKPRGPASVFSRFTKQHVQQNSKPPERAPQTVEPEAPRELKPSAGYNKEVSACAGLLRELYEKQIRIFHAQNNVGSGQKEREKMCEEAYALRIEIKRRIDTWRSADVDWSDEEVECIEEIYDHLNDMLSSEISMESAPEPTRRATTRVRPGRGPAGSIRTTRTARTTRAPILEDDMMTLNESDIGTIPDTETYRTSNPSRSSFGGYGGRNVRGRPMDDDMMTLNESDTRSMADNETLASFRRY